jgi:hypothetical protein
MTAAQVSRRLSLLVVLLPGCAGSRKPAEAPLPTTTCQLWKVTVENEFPFPVSTYVYSTKGRASLGAAPSGRSEQYSSDSGQITFTPPLGMSLIARGRQIRGILSCAMRAPT